MSTEGTAEALRQLGLSSNGLAATHSWVWPTRHSDSPALVDSLRTRGSMCLLPSIPQSLRRNTHLSRGG